MSSMIHDMIDYHSTVTNIVAGQRLYVQYVCTSARAIPGSEYCVPGSSFLILHSAFDFDFDLNDAMTFRLIGAI